MGSYTVILYVAQNFVNTFDDVTQNFSLLKNFDVTQFSLLIKNFACDTKFLKSLYYCTS